MPRPTWTPEQEAVLASGAGAAASAGAGTGKTTFLIDKLVRAAAAGARPDRMVCITFTNKAAGELKDRAREAFRRELVASAQPELWRRRLRQLEQAAVCTIHALAGRLLREFPVQADLDTDLAALDEREASDLRRKAADRVLRRRLEDSPDDFRALLRLRYGRREGAYVESLEGLLRKCIEGFFNAGADADRLRADVESNWKEDPRVGAEFADTIAAVLDEYRTLKAGRPDFADLLLRARDLLRDNPGVRRTLQHRFELVLLDEAQDTDQVQTEILTYLTNQDVSPADPHSSSFIVHPSSLPFVVVGDRKQALYRFRGADHTRFAELTRRLLDAGGKQVSLQDNRRCAPGIVAFVNEFAPDLVRGSLDYEPARDDLIARRPDHGSPCVYRLDAPSIHSRADERRRSEGDSIARLIRHLVDPASKFVVYDRDERPRRPRPGDVAILFAKTIGADAYAAALREHDIAFSLERGTSFYGSPVVADARAFLKVLINPRDSASAAALLRSPLFGLTDEQWLALGQASGGFRLDRLAVLRRKESDSDDPASFHPSSFILHPSAQALLDVLDDLRPIRDRIAPDELLRRWWETAGEGPFRAAGDEGRRHAANMAKLLDIAREHSATGPVGLRDFVDHLEREADRDLEADASSAGPDDDVVRLMTVHKSKGLEFPIVILADCAAGVWWGKAPTLVFDRTFGLVGKVWDDEKGALTESDALKRRQKLEKQAVFDDQRAALYVALTRARDLLFLSGDFGRSRVESWRKWIDDSAAAHRIRSISVDAFREGEAPAADPHPALIPTGHWPLTTGHSSSSPDPTSTPGPKPQTPDPIERLRSPLTQRRAIERWSVARLVERRAEQIGADDWLDRPADLEPEAAAEVGRLVHGLLEQVDFAAPPDRPTLLRMAANLGAQLKRPEVARAVDALLRSLSTPSLRDLARAGSADIRRELPLRLEIVRGPRTLIIEGQADLLASTPAGRRLIEFKMSPASRLDLHRFQVHIYTLALIRRNLAPSEAAVLFLGEVGGGCSEARIPLDRFRPDAFEQTLLSMVFEDLTPANL